MLSSLHIENIAVIERADIDFGPGLNVLTGETGAGKSIVIDSINAVLGARTSRELVRFGAEKALAGAVFDDDRAADWCGENDIDAEDETIIQRRVAADGKSSARINGQPAAAQQLRELGALLLDVHGQNDGRQLLDEARHLRYLDRFGAHDGQLAGFSEKYARYSATKRDMERLRLDDVEKERLTESLTYQIRELEAARLTPGEEDELSARRDLMANATKLTEAIDGAYSALYEADSSAIGLAADARELTERAARYSPELEETAKIISDAGYMLQDAAERLNDARAALDFSPEEYDRIETRLALLRRLTKKYNTDEQGLIDHLEQCRKHLDELEYAGDRLIQLQKQAERERQAALKSAEELSRERRAAAEALTKRITEELRYLNMPSVRFAVDFQPVENEDGFTSSGADEVRFLMSANAGEAPGRISRIASGGELSRIMLAMKSVFAEKDAVPSLVFDEIDTGVSGIAAQRVGEKLAALARHKQVICVTHLPQIAAMADTHFAISKAERDGRTYTAVTELDRAGRLRELARLYGGDNVTELSLRSADEQLSAAEEFKAGLKA
ncbi:MAG: DNA repair protein RecN [Butyricicoccus sp.]|nr:DNA repair protein RecN [Butyricicoccus sp.]